MALTKQGSLLIAAKKLGVSVEKYSALRASGLKHCTKCKLWKRQVEFNKDKSRSDGLKAKCKECSHKRQNPISQSLFAKKKSEGFGWCIGCQSWLPLNEIKHARCRKHIREYENERYKNDPNYRFKRKNKTSLRRRNVEAVPIEGEEYLIDYFDGLCAYCNHEATTFDHIVPISKGGRTLPGNIVPACLSCNSSKKDKDVADWFQEKKLEMKYQLESIMIKGAEDMCSD